MNLPFTEEQFLDIFGQYHMGTWPSAVIAYLLAGLMIYMLVKKSRYLTYALSMLWIWTGAVYHIAFFSSINKAALAFGAIFIIQGMALLYLGITNKIEYGLKNKTRLYIGAFLILFALILYPLAGIAAGLKYPAMPLFPLPCPLTILTFGMLLNTEKLPRASLIIPTLWAFIGFSAAFSMHIYQDVMLPISAVLSIILLFRVKAGESKTKQA